MSLCFSLLFNTWCKRTTVNFCVSSFNKLQRELLFVLAATSTRCPQDVFFQWWVCFLVMNSAWDKLSIRKSSFSLMPQVICCIISCYIQDYEVMNSKVGLVIEGGGWQNGAQQLLLCGSINVPSLEFVFFSLEDLQQVADWYGMPICLSFFKTASYFFLLRSTCHSPYLLGIYLPGVKIWLHSLPSWMSLTTWGVHLNCFTLWFKEKQSVQVY